MVRPLGILLEEEWTRSLFLYSACSSKDFQSKLKQTLTLKYNNYIDHILCKKTAKVKEIQSISILKSNYHVKCPNTLLEY